MPQAVTSRARWRGETVEYCASLFEFEDPGVVVSLHGGVINQQGRPFTHGFEVRFERATIQFEFAACADESESMPLKVLTDDGQVLRPQAGDPDPVAAFVAELQEVANVLAHGNRQSILDGGLAGDAIELCHAQTRSARTGQTVRLQP
jgi:predicted dehydrogenase